MNSDNSIDVSSSSNDDDILNNTLKSQVDHAFTNMMPPRKVDKDLMNAEKMPVKKSHN